MHYVEVDLYVSEQAMWFRTLVFFIAGLFSLAVLVMTAQERFRYIPQNEKAEAAFQQSLQNAEHLTQLERSVSDLRALSLDVRLTKIEATLDTIWKLLMGILVPLVLLIFDRFIISVIPMFRRKSDSN
ncbi:MAG TPA: hypothetical protein VNL17_14300 [Verrucomicrobiae bacterium]|nr:hypothetical protein [Verrucomicrobiae bacterium]